MNVLWSVPLAGFSTDAERDALAGNAKSDAVNYFNEVNGAGVKREERLLGVRGSAYRGIVIRSD